MPYYTWQGVNLKADFQTGVSFARSEKELDRFLFQQDIALIKIKHVSTRRSKKINDATLITFFNHVASLLDAGLKIPQALQTVYKQLPQGALKEIVFALSGEIQEGQSLAAALAMYPWIFNVVTVHMVRVGEQIGSVSVVLKALANYHDAKQKFKRKIFQALMIPVVTFCFFLVIALVILIMVVPQFETIFNSLGGTVPGATAFLIGMSDFFRTYGLILVGVVAFSILCVQRIVSKREGVSILSGLPFMQTLGRNCGIMHTMQALALLLGNGVNLVQAMDISRYVLSDKKMNSQFVAAAKAVASGYALHEAFVLYAKIFAQENIIALISIGHETGQLSQAFNAIARMYEEKVMRQLQYITLFVQPTLMLVLGLLITSMIVAIYMPLFSLAHIV
jgi:type IV pilus assembly protein PilC